MTWLFTSVDKWKWYCTNSSTLLEPAQFVFNESTGKDSSHWCCCWWWCKQKPIRASSASPKIWRTTTLPKSRETSSWRNKLWALFCWFRNMKCLPFTVKKQLRWVREALYILLWGRPRYWDEIGAALVRKHIILCVKWPLWETRICSKWFQMLISHTYIQTCTHIHTVLRVMLTLWRLIVLALPCNFASSAH